MAVALFHKEIFFAGVILFAATWWLMTRATNWQQLTLINLAGGFTFSIALNMIIILIGLLAGETERGRSFGVLTLTSGLSVLLGSWADPSPLTSGAYLSLRTNATKAQFDDIAVSAVIIIWSGSALPCARRVRNSICVAITRPARRWRPIAPVRRS